MAEADHRDEPVPVWRAVCWAPSRRVEAAVTRTTWLRHGNSTQSMALPVLLPVSG